MKIATWNVNGLRARLDFVLHWLQARAPDVVGLQELKLTDDEFPVEALRAAGYHAAIHGQKSWNGVAILSREPLTVERRGLPGQAALGARLITASVGDLAFTTLYCPNGKSTDHDDYARKLAWYDSLLALVKGQHDPRRPAVLCGDFNIVPAPIDSWNEAGLAGHIFHTDAERERLRRLLACGFTDLFRHHLPDTQFFSWDYRAGAFHRNHGLRIDLLPRRRLSPQPRAPHRPAARYCERRGAPASRRSRPGLSQEERGAHRLRPRPGHRRARLSGEEGRPGLRHGMSMPVAPDGAGDTVLFGPGVCPAGAAGGRQRPARAACAHSSATVR